MLRKSFFRSSGVIPHCVLAAISEGWPPHTRGIQLAHAKLCTAEWLYCVEDLSEQWTGGDRCHCSPQSRECFIEWNFLPPHYVAFILLLQRVEGFLQRTCKSCAWYMFWVAWDVVAASKEFSIKLPFEYVNSASFLQRSLAPRPASRVDIMGNALSCCRPGSSDNVDSSEVSTVVRSVNSLQSWFTELDDAKSVHSGLSWGACFRCEVCLQTSGDTWSAATWPPRRFAALRVIQG